MVHTKYFEPNEHWIDSGMPISDQFEMTERMTLIEGGKMLQIEYTMTDPEELEGRVEEHQEWLRHGLQRHSRGRVPAEPEQEPAQHRRRARLKWIGGRKRRRRSSAETTRAGQCRRAWAERGESAASRRSRAWSRPPASPPWLRRAPRYLPSGSVMPM